MRLSQKEQQMRHDLIAQNEYFCTVCDTVKPLSEFSPSKYNTFGYVSTCHACRRRKRHEASKRVVIDLPNEVWKPLPDYDNKYMVSNFGRVKNVKFHRGSSEVLLSQHEDKGGYLNVDLITSLEKKCQGVHRLVAIVFLGYQADMEVDHLDRNPKNNNMTNLQWKTTLDNSKNRGAVLGTVSRFKGVSPHRGKWLAQLTHQARTYHLGLFPTEEEAAQAYDVKALEFGILTNATLELFKTKE